MAILATPGLLAHIKGALGKQIVIKQYKNKVVITAYPERTRKKRKKPSVLKKMLEDDFAAAVKYAQAILRDPVKKKAYAKKVKKGQLVYHYAISEYKRKYGAKRKGQGWVKGELDS